jgi:hypothetical protein
MEHVPVHLLSDQLRYPTHQVADTTIEADHYVGGRPEHLSEVGPNRDGGRGAERHGQTVNDRRGVPLPTFRR